MYKTTHIKENTTKVIYLLNQVKEKNCTKLCKIQTKNKKFSNNALTLDLELYDKCIPIVSMLSYENCDRSTPWWKNLDYISSSFKIIR